MGDKAAQDKDYSYYFDLFLRTGEIMSGIIREISELDPLLDFPTDLEILFQVAPPRLAVAHWAELAAGEFTAINAIIQTERKVTKNTANRILSYISICFELRIMTDDLPDKPRRYRLLSKAMFPSTERPS